MPVRVLRDQSGDRGRAASEGELSDIQLASENEELEPSQHLLVGQVGRLPYSSILLAPAVTVVC